MPPRARSRSPRVRFAWAVLAMLLSAPAALSAQDAIVRGRVLQAESGRPIANATVALRAANRETRTDSLGQFTLANLRAGTDELVVQAVGFGPARATVPITGGAPLELDVELDPLAPTLERVVTEADADGARNFAMAEFEERRAMRLGRYITRSELLRDRGRTFDAVVRTRLPGVRLVNDTGKIVATSGRGTVSIQTPIAGICRVNVLVDGVLRYANGSGLPPFDLRSLEASMIAGVEYYTPASTPERFNLRGNAPCGTLVIWLQN